MEIKIPEKVENIINTLEKKGFEAYAVGGCVRDSILGKAPSDWDITTSAQPHEVQANFDKTYTTGIKHGTVTVIIGNEAFEITTFRTEEGYSDFRRPDKVHFVTNLKEDLKRRDFTINAMAYSPSGGLFDFFDGVGDLDKRVIRAVGSPKERFSEDALRMLRAVRFAARLGFNIEGATAEGIRECALLIEKISRERIREELTGILMSQNPDYMEMLYKLGVLEFILPELSLCFETPQNNPYHAFNVGRHTMEALKNSEQDINVRWAVMLHDVGKAFTRTTDSKNIDHFHGHEKVSEKIAERVMDEYRFDNDSRRIVTALVRYHDRQILPEERAVRRILNKLGEKVLRLLLLVKRADNSGKNQEKQDKGIRAIERIDELLDEVIRKNQCTTLNTLEIKGGDLISMGLPPGPLVGKVLEIILDKVIDSPELNNHEQLIKEAQKILQNMK